MTSRILVIVGISIAVVIGTYMLGRFADKD